MSVPPQVATETVLCCLCGSGEHTIVGAGRDFEYRSCSTDWKFVRCAGCGHHYLRERPSQEALTTVYPPHYGNYANSANPGLAFRLKAAMERHTLRRLTAGQKVTAVFDVGCGDGRLLDVVKGACPTANRLAGCEISSFAAQNARKKGYDVEIGSFESLAFASDSFDLVALIQVLEHLCDPPGAIHKIAGMLRAGGRVLIETPSTDCLDFRLFKRRHWGGYHFPRHFNLFVREHVEKLLRAAGLEPISYAVKLQPVHWVWTAHHWFEEKGAPAYFYSAFHIKNPFWLSLATLIDAPQVLLSGKSSNMQIVAQKVKR
jgi:SAM-dependent methyltransferase